LFNWDFHTIKCNTINTGLNRIYYIYFRKKVMVDNLMSLYTMFMRDKKKERFDIILEPLQAMTQLAFMAFCPKGSKLSIANNLLVVQTPTWMQGILRTYNHDKRDDVFFLFNAIVRFSRFYGYLQHDTNMESRQLHKLLITLSKRGIDNMLLTYANVEQPALLHTLHMYRNMLDKPELFTMECERDSGGKADVVKTESGKGGKGRKGNDTITVQASHEPADETLANEAKNNIDDVFLKITRIYSQHELNILYNTFSLLNQHPENYLTYMQGLNALFEPTYKEIRKWINDNIIY